MYLGIGEKTGKGFYQSHLRTALYYTYTKGTLYHNNDKRLPVDKLDTQDCRSKVAELEVENLLPPQVREVRPGRATRDDCP